MPSIKNSKRDDMVKKICIYDISHFHPSLLINPEEDYLVKRLGHTSIKTTIDTYSHLNPSKKKDLADKVDALI